MKKYNSYQASGIEWLEKIPEHWNVDRLKNFFSFGTGLSITKKNLLDIGIPCVSYGEVHSKYGFEVNPEIHSLKCVSKEYLNTSKKSLLKKGDFIFADTSEDIKGSGNFTYLNSDIKVFAGYHTIAAKPKRKLNHRYVAYLFDSISFRRQFQSNVTGIKVYSITQSLLNKLNIFFPTAVEQIAIANYLDSKTQVIDKKINLLNKKIDCYRELRKSIINETITNGHDKKVKLQSRSFEFVIPENWVKYRLKDLGSLFSGLSGKSGDDFSHDNSPHNKQFIPFTNIANNIYLKRNHLGKVVIYENEKQNQVKKGDIFFLMSSEGYDDIGKSATLAEDFDETYLNSFCKGFRVNPRKANPYFLNYLMLSDYYRQLLIVEGKGFTRINLKMEKINDFQVYIPKSIAVQNELVKYLDAKLDMIAKIILNIENQVCKLVELRKTLINDVVTGTIKITQE